MSEPNRDAAVAEIARIACVSLETAGNALDAALKKLHGVAEEQAEQAPQQSEGDIRRIFASDSGKGHEKTGK